MTFPAFLLLLTTSSSEVSNKTLFKSRFTHYTPDLFFIIFYATLFLFSGLLDVSFTFCLFFIGGNTIVGSIFLGTIILPGAIEFVLESNTDECLPNVKVNKFFVFCISIAGFSAMISSLRLSTEIFWKTAKTEYVRPLKCYTYSFFQIKNESMSAVKLHCFLYAAFKSLPRVLLLSVFLLESHLKDVVTLHGGIVIILNMAVFSFTMAITFPLRSTPRVFTSSICVLLNAFNKFMATMSSCCVVLAVFATVFKSIRFYALLVPFFRFLTWGWPCWKTLKSRTFPLPTLAFLAYFFLLTFFSTFIYIHPFEGIGKLHYYIFYFIEFLEEIIVIYMFTEVSLDHVTSYFAFRVVMIGFLSSFGLVNILHKYKQEKTKHGCASRASGDTEKLEEEIRNEEKLGEDDSPQERRKTMTRNPV